ncbi:hypothetical protein Tco_1331559 [Tanacetum coccineum]
MMSGIDHSQQHRRFAARGNGYEERDLRDAEIEHLCQRVCKLETNSFDRYDERADTMETQSVVDEHADTDDGLQPNDFLDWIQTVERIFDLRDIPERLNVKLVAIKLKKICLVVVGTCADSAFSGQQTQSGNRLALWVERLLAQKSKTFPKFPTYPRTPTTGPPNTRMGPTKADPPVIPTTQTENPTPWALPAEVIPLVDEFSNIFPDDIPGGLPLMREIQHCIDFIPDASIPNKPV